MASFDSITADLIVALEEEINAIKESGGTEQIGVHDGRYGGIAAGRFLYIFLLDTELNIPSDTPAQLRIDKVSHETIIVSVQGFEITLGIQDDLGPFIPKAVLSLSDNNEIQGGAVVRVGALARQDPELQQVTMEAVLERKSKDLRRQQEELGVERKRILAVRDKLAATIRVIEAVEKSEQRVASAKDALITAEQKVQEAEDAILQVRQTLGDLHNKLQQAERPGSFDGSFSVLTQRLSAVRS